MLMTNNLHEIKRTLTAQRRFMQSLSTRDWDTVRGDSGLPGRESDNPRDSHQETTSWHEADTVKKATMNVAECFGKIKSELRYAKCEAGWAHLGPRDLVELTHLLKNILSSILGMSSLVEATDRIEKRGGWESFRGSSISRTMTQFELNAREEKEKQQWHWIFEQIRGPTQQLLQKMTEGLDHSMYALRLEKPPAFSRSDLEANGNHTAMQLGEMIENFLEQRRGPLMSWCAEKGMDEPSQMESLRSGMKSADYQLRERHQFQLYLFLDVSSS